MHRRTFILWAILLLLGMQPGYAVFDPPRIAFVINPDGAGHPTDAVRTYYINKGLESSINKGDLLNVYREKRATQIAPAVRLFIGVMKVTRSQQGSALGHFIPNEAAVASPPDPPQDSDEERHRGTDPRHRLRGALRSGADVVEEQCCTRVSEGRRLRQQLRPKPPDY